MFVASVRVCVCVCELAAAIMSQNNENVIDKSIRKNAIELESKHEEFETRSQPWRFTSVHSQSSRFDYFVSR